MNIEELGGFLTAHALTMVESGDTQVVFHGHVKDGQDHVIRIKQGLLTKNVKIGQRKLLENTEGAETAVLVYNCMSRLMALPDYGHGDLIVVEIKPYNENQSSIIFGLWYELADIGEGKAGRILPNALSFFYASPSLDKALFLRSFEKGFSEHEFGNQILDTSTIELSKLQDINTKSENILFFSKIGYGHGEILLQDFAVSDVSEKYDDYRWHLPEGELPEGKTEAAFCVHIGVLLIWCVLNDLAGKNHTDHVADIKRQYMKRSSSPGQWCLDRAGGCLTNEDLNDEGNLFVKDYMQDYYDDFYESADPNDEVAVYNVPDNWEIYDTISPVISRAYSEWCRRARKRHG